jgi:hypothetical protein
LVASVRPRELEEIDPTAKKSTMKNMRRFVIAGVLSALMMAGFGARPGMAQPRAHVYLLRGLLNIFSLGMDTLAEKIQRHGIYATVHNHTEWETLAEQAAAAYRAGKEGPIIIVGHSLGADAVMQMSAYLGRKGVPVALAVPFDARGSYATSSNVGRLLNLTHAGYGYMSRGAGFHGSLSNMDVPWMEVLISGECAPQGTGITPGSQPCPPLSQRF